MTDYNDYTEFIEIATVAIAELDKVRMMQRNTHGEDVTRSDVIIWLMTKVSEDMEFRKVVDNMEVKEKDK